VSQPSGRTDIEPLVAAIRARISDAIGIWLFGSVAQGHERPDSDIDLAVLARSKVDAIQLFELGLDLGVLANRDVDLVDLRVVSTVMRKVIVTTGRLVFAADSVACARFAADSVALYVALREEQRVVLGPRRSGKDDRSG
jgi:predicted nucleotidyltransferase